MKKIFFIHFLLIGIIAQSQIIGNQNLVAQTEAKDATDVYAIDIDADGDLDILASSSANKTIAWYENLDGQGTFSAQKPITTEAVGANSVYAADIDSDGDMDVLSASRWDNKIAWYENLDGHGTFGNQMIITNSANGARDVFAIDVDGDGDMDVLTASESDHTIAWYENLDGHGSFSLKNIVNASAVRAISVYAADLDNDGDMDILSASSGDKTIAWYENLDGQGTFSAKRVLNNSALNAMSVYAADIDGDGDMDVLSASKCDNSLSWYENLDGHGTFSSEILIDNSAENATDIYAADIDGDGDMDVVSSQASYKIAWYENTDGQGTFGSQQVITTAVDYGIAVYAADIDGDNDLDVLSASFNDDKIAWYKNTDGLGTFGAQQVITTLLYYPELLTSIDIDGDGDLDVLTATHYAKQISWFENLDGNGHFGRQKIIDNLLNNLLAFDTSDIDGDGDIDVVFTTHDNKIGWYKNIDGQGNFSAQQIISDMVENPTEVYVADMDNDNNNDIVLLYNDKIVWYKNLDGLGNFGMQQVISDNAMSRDFQQNLQVTDLDGDGNLDIVFLTSNSLSWCKNSGNGTFNTEQMITSLNFSFDKKVYAADLDGDNDTDLVLTSAQDSKITWVENLDGNATFTGEQVITDTVSFDNNISISDFDNDGDLDIIISSYMNHQILWLENLGNSNGFNNIQVLTNSIDNDTYVCNSMCLFDMDNDNDMDILFAENTSYNDKILWFENLTIAGISEQELSNLTIYPNPSNHEIYFKIDETIKDIFIYDMLGRLVLKNTFNKNTHSIDISKLKKGNYILDIYTKNHKKMTAKLIVD